MFLEEKVVFEMTDERVIVEAPKEVVEELARLCDGRRTITDVLQKISENWDHDSVRVLVDGLIDSSVIIDARDQSTSVWKTVRNPALFPVRKTEEEVQALVQSARDRHWLSETKGEECFTPPQSAFAGILDMRRSVRSFSGGLVNMDSIFRMLWCAYGETHLSRRTVPSAGALYPLTIHLVLMKTGHGFSKGVYEVRFGEDRLVRLQKLHTDVFEVSRAFIDPLMLEKIHGLVVVSGAFSISAEKYGNRSLLYVPLEAGHVAQNILLSAQESSVDTLQVGGFVDLLLSRALRLDEEYAPLTTILFGVEELTGDTALEEKSPLFIDWAVPLAGTFAPPFAIASARVSEKRSWSHGRDADPRLALTKAISEAREWGSCGCLSPNMVKARFRDLQNAVDPREVILFSPEQYQSEGFHFGEFGEDTECEWAPAKELKTGAKAYILADLVYFPYFPETPYHAYANSSGCAAHPSRDLAIEKAILELVERDAFMNAYLLKLDTPAILQHTLSQDVELRIEALRNQGFEVVVKDLSLDLAPVVAVFAQSERLSFTTCAASSSFDVMDAVSHALLEVEASVLARLHNGEPSEQLPENVVMPLDHGRLYAQKKFFKKADFMIASTREKPLSELGSGAAHTLSDLLMRIESLGWSVYIVDLELSEELGGNNGLHIVRAIVPGMVPMTFGAGQYPGGMERVYEIGRKFGNREYVIYDIVSFPHPFE